MPIHTEAVSLINIQEVLDRTLFTPTAINQRIYVPIIRMYTYRVHTAMCFQKHDQCTATIRHRTRRI